jgi:hypothetical protein
MYRKEIPTQRNDLPNVILLNAFSHKRQLSQKNPVPKFRTIVHVIVLAFIIQFHSAAQASPP